MRRRIKRVVLFCSMLILACGFAISLNHRVVLLKLAAPFLPDPGLGPRTDETPETRWFDDYFTVFEIDDQTYAIGETRYHQSNFNYLLIGANRAVLFDSGPGVRDIVPVVRSLTTLPVTTVASHLHYDHIGQYNGFESSAMIDLPALRNRATKAGQLAVLESEHLGYLEDIPTPVLDVGEWWAPGQTVDLGGRHIVVHSTPGHTLDSLVLQDPERAQFFTGDTVYPGELFAFLPHSSLGDYARTTDRLLELVSDTAVLYGAHRVATSGLPTLARTDLLDLRRALHAVESGDAIEEGLFPRTLEVNERLALWMDFPWSRRWK